MGNGAAVASTGDITLQRYRELEKKCSSGYFQYNAEEYAMVLRQVMSLDLLDCLELLLVSGDVKRANGVHLAAQLGKLEALEILLSAGFPGSLKDSEGRTPLHLACAAVTEDSPLCVSLLALQYPSTIRSLDRSGNTPAHVAVNSNNSAVLQALLMQGDAWQSLNNLQGLTPLALARKLERKDCLAVLTSSSVSPVPSLSKKQQRKQQQASQERIMAVWEKFFENAFKLAGVEDDDYGYPAPPQQSKASSTMLTAGSKDYNHGSYSNSQKGELHQHKQEAYESDYMENWMQHVVVRYHDDSGTDALVVVNAVTRLQVWLQAFLDDLYYAGSDYWFLHYDAESVASWSPPQSLEEVPCMGWMAFYRPADNLTSWINLVTGVQEDYLPIVSTYDLLAAYNLCAYWDPQLGRSVDWVYPDHSVTRAWVCVVSCTDEDVQYYCNLCTGDTSWTTPDNWQEMQERDWNGWILCCLEDNQSQLFWYDESTGTSEWCDS